MTGAGLAAVRKIAIEAVPIDPVATYADRLRVADSNAIVTYIQANAAVVVAGVTLVTAGLANSGPGTGTIT